MKMSIENEIRHSRFKMSHRNQIRDENEYRNPNHNSKSQILSKFDFTNLDFYADICRMRMTFTGVLQIRILHGDTFGILGDT
jgi:hypothetical protein